MARGMCPRCNTEQALKNDGTPRKHNRPDGSVCEPLVESPEESQVPEEQPEPPAKNDGGYEWSLTVAAPCIYLDDQGWHLANLRMAAKLAEDAGHTVTGEGHQVGADEADGRVTVTYQVPVNN